MGNNYYSLESQVSDPGIEINENIISWKDLQFILAWIKWDYTLLDKGDESLARNLNKWIQYKKNQTYRLDNKAAQTVLLNDRAVIVLNESGSMNNNQKLLNDLIELIILELLKSHLSDEWVHIYKTSEFDDIKSWLDYILIWKHWGKLGIDLTLSTSEASIEKKNLQTTWLPIEFLASVEGREYIIKNGKILIKNLKWSKIKKYVLPLEPQLVQFFINEYIDQIVWYDNPEEIGSDIALDAWSMITEEYNKWGFWNISKWIYYWITEKEIIESIDEVKQELSKILN